MRVSEVRGAPRCVRRCLRADDAPAARARRQSAASLAVASARGPRPKTADRRSFAPWSGNARGATGASYHLPPGRGGILPRDGPSPKVRRPLVHHHLFPGPLSIRMIRRRVRGGDRRSADNGSRPDSTGLRDCAQPTKPWGGDGTTPPPASGRPSRTSTASRAFVLSPGYRGKAASSGYRPSAGGRDRPWSRAGRALRRLGRPSPAGAARRAYEGNAASPAARPPCRSHDASAGRAGRPLSSHRALPGAGPHPSERRAKPNGPPGACSRPVASGRRGVRHGPASMRRGVYRRCRGTRAVAPTSISALLRTVRGLGLMGADPSRTLSSME